MYSALRVVDHKPSVCVVSRHIPRQLRLFSSPSRTRLGFRTGAPLTQANGWLLLRVHTLLWPALRVSWIEGADPCTAQDAVPARVLVLISNGGSRRARARKAPTGTQYGSARWPGRCWGGRSRSPSQGSLRALSGKGVISVAARPRDHCCCALGELHVEVGALGTARWRRSWPRRCFGWSCILVSTSSSKWPRVNAWPAHAPRTRWDSPPQHIGVWKGATQAPECFLEGECSTRAVHEMSG